MWNCEACTSYVAFCHVPSVLCVHTQSPAGLRMPLYSLPDGQRFAGFASVLGFSHFISVAHSHASSECR